MEKFCLCLCDVFQLFILWESQYTKPMHQKLIIKRKAFFLPDSLSSTHPKGIEKFSAPKMLKEQGICLLKLLMGDYWKKCLVMSTSGAEQMNEYMLKSFALRPNVPLILQSIQSEKQVFCMQSLVIINNLEKLLILRSIN